MLRERVATFGPAPGLVGVETLPFENGDQPNLTGARSDLPAVVLLNAGVVHRIGPHRLTVTLARHLAEAGFHVLRYDVSGLGDSPSRSGGSRMGVAIADAQAAMDYLTRSSGHRRFIVGGLCSGADNSVRVGLVDKRVVGMILLDPYAYRTARFYVERLLKKCQEQSSRDPSWALRYTLARLDSGLRRWTDRLTGRSEDKTKKGGGARFRQGRLHPPREIFGQHLRRLTDRGIRILAVYTGGTSDTYNYAEQFADCFRPFGVADRIESLYMPRADHTFTEIASQRDLCDSAVRWLRSIFAPQTCNPELPTNDREISGDTGAVLAPGGGAPEPHGANGDRGGEAAGEPQRLHSQVTTMVPCAISDEAAQPLPGAPSPAVPSSGMQDACASGMDRVALLDQQMRLVQAQLELVAQLRVSRRRR